MSAKQKSADRKTIREGNEPEVMQGRVVSVVNAEARRDPEDGRCWGVFGVKMGKQLLTHPWIPPGFSGRTGSGSLSLVGFRRPSPPGMCLASRCSVPKPALLCCPARAPACSLRSLVLEGLHIHRLSAESH